MTGKTKQVFMVLNPVAGNSDPVQLRQAAESRFAEAGWSFDIYETTGEESLPEVVHTAVAAGADLVVAAGGDGTVSEVADALVNTDISLGIVPVGTGNALAQALNLSLEPDQALTAIVSSTRRRALDVLQLADGFLVLQMGIGVDSLMMHQTSHEEKRRLGVMAYLWTAVKQLLGFQPHQFTLLLDGRTRTVEASQIMVANAGAVGIRPLQWGPDIEPDDGHVDICVIRARTLLDYGRVAWHILRGQQRQAGNLNYYQAEHTLEIEANPPLPVHGDGEMLGETPVTAKIIPAALHVIVPAIKA